MDNAKKILDYCKNYQRIVNFDYLQDDLISAKLIRVYKDYVFKVNINSSEEVEELTHFDYVLGKYIDDYNFRNNNLGSMTQFRFNNENVISNSIQDNDNIMFNDNNFNGNNHSCRRYK